MLKCLNVKMILIARVFSSGLCFMLGFASHILADAAPDILDIGKFAVLVALGIMSLFLRLKLRARHC